MKKKTIFIFLLFMFLKIDLKAKEYNIIATINNYIITEIDLSNEIKIINILNSQNINNLTLKKIALNNLIDEKIKLIEIEKEGLEYVESVINKNFEIFKSNSNLKKENIDHLLKKLIKEKIYIDQSWNNLINQKYSWKINININELEKKINDKSKILSEEEYLKLKDNLILNEKNKKLEVFSKFHFNKIKKETLIKFF